MIVLTVILPCRNEERFIGECIQSVLDGTWPHEQLQLLVVDGRSTDATRAIADRFAARHPAIEVLDNQRRTAPAALNIGLTHARGDLIVRLDAHVRYPPDYLARLAARLEASGADNVGGRVETLPGGTTIVARAIARALAHPFGVGNSRFRLPADEGAEPEWVDTVPFGCFRRSLFARIGGFDEELVRNQDDELNARIIRRGGRVLLDPSIVAQYVARPTYAQLARMYFQYGLFKPLAARKAGAVLTVRQFVPAVFLLALVLGALLALWWPPARLGFFGLLALYAAATVVAAAPSVRPLGARGILAVAGAFAVIHASYGWGYLRGLLKLLPHRSLAADPSALPLSR